MSLSVDSTLVGEPVATEDRILWERCRIGYLVVIAGIGVVLVGELVLRPGQRQNITLIQATNIAFLLVCLAIGRNPAARSLNCLICLLGFTATAVATGATGILAKDPTSPIVVLVGLSMGAAVLVPWGVRYQIPAVLITSAVATWTVMSIHPASREFRLQPIGSILPTFGASVIVAYLLRRERMAVAVAEVERVRQERGLREANRKLASEVGEHEKTEQRLRFALFELDHRVKNTLATVQSIAEQSLDSASSLQEFAEGFRNRIRAMADFHTALAAQRWQAIGLRELIELVVGPYRLHEGEVTVRCGEADIKASDARIVGMVLHELATNAAKYGALSTGCGRVEIYAEISDTAPRRLHMTWQEQGGPPVAEPTRRGLGMKVIEEAVAYESGGMARLDFAKRGVRCEIDMPLRTALGSN